MFIKSCSQGVDEGIAYCCTCISFTSTHRYKDVDLFYILLQIGFHISSMQFWIYIWRSVKSEPICNTILIKNTQWDAFITWSILVKTLATDKRYPIARPWGRGMGCLLSEKNSDWCSPEVTVVLYAISCYIWPCYNVTHLYILWGKVNISECHDDVKGRFIYGVREIQCSLPLIGRDSYVLLNLTYHITLTQSVTTKQFRIQLWPLIVPCGPFY